MYVHNHSLVQQSTSFFHTFPRLQALSYYYLFLFFFFFQAEDGIRDWSVTGVQTCALPICWKTIRLPMASNLKNGCTLRTPVANANSSRSAAPTSTVLSGIKAGSTCRSEIGRASCRERV